MLIQSYDNKISYKGLGRQLSANLYSEGTIRKLQNIYPKSQGIVGNLPAQWIQNIPPKNRAKNIPLIYKYLGKLEKYNMSEFLRSKFMTIILKTFKAIPLNEHVNIRFLNEGCFGSGNKIISSNPNKKPLFIKKFLKLKTHDIDWAIENRHGILPEANAKQMVKKKIKKNGEKQLFSNFYYADIKNGYYIEDYIASESYIFKPGKQLDITSSCESIIYKALEKIGLIHGDLSRNNYFIKYINGVKRPVCFDLGGVKKK